MPNDAQAPLMTVKAVSELTGFSPYTVRQMAREGRIPSVKFGGQHRFRPTDLTKWLDKLSKAAGR